MKLSIIIPCYNENEFIEKVVENIHKQTHIDKEIIIVNDGSNSQTMDILNRLVN